MRINLEKFIRFIYTHPAADDVLSQVAGFKPCKKDVRMYPHDGGVDVVMPSPSGYISLGRYWLYVNVRGCERERMEYDAAWWKIMRAAALKGIDPEELGEVED